MDIVNMSLIRSFTTRRSKPSVDLTPAHVGRAASQRAGRPVARSKISSPVALVSSTNSLSFDAPNIAGTAPIQYGNDKLDTSAASSQSAEDSDASTLSISSDTDASSVDDSSPSTPEPEENHLSCYFKPRVYIQSTGSSPTESTRTSLEAPLIPKRVPSHSKKAHEHMHRKRSIQRLMSPPASIVKRSSADMFRSTESPKENPFGPELVQLDQIAEEMSQTVRDAEAEADARVMEKYDLAHLAASDYLAEIHANPYEADQPSWI